MTMRRPNAIDCLLALSVVLAIALVVRSSRDRGPGSIPAAEPVSGDFTRLMESLQQIDRRLSGIEALLAASDQAPVRPGVRTAVSDAPGGAEAVPEIDAVRGQVDELAQVLTAQTERQQLASMKRRSARELLDSNPEPKWEELQKIIDLWFHDESLALRELRLASAEEVIGRFGAPMDVWGSDVGLNCVWGQGTDPAGGYQSEVWVCFKDGYVTMVGVK